MSEVTLEELAVAVGAAPDAMSRGAAMRELALENHLAGQDGLAEAWAERALTVHEVFSMQNPDNGPIKHELIASAGVYALALTSSAREKDGDSSDYRAKARRAIDIAYRATKEL
jgi:hypothetical protein